MISCGHHIVSVRSPLSLVSDPDRSSQKTVCIAFRCEKWDAFLERVQPIEAVRHFLQRAGGYSLTALTNEEALFYCYGREATGKSTFQDALRMAAGTYGKASKFKTFLTGRVESNAPREDVARLIGARCVTCSEVSKATRWDSALIKTLVSGERYLARVPYSDTSIEFDPVFKLWFSANDRPTLDYDDSAAFRRFYVIPFDVHIPEAERDRSLKSYFKHDEEARKAILAFFLDGATEWYRRSKEGTRDGLQAPEEVKAAVRDYKASMNPLYEFVLNECAMGIDLTGLDLTTLNVEVDYKNCKLFEESAASLWDVFSDIRKGYDTKAVRSSRSMGKYLSALGFESFRDTKTKERSWSGLRLVKDTEEWPPKKDLLDHGRLAVYKALLQKLFQPSSLMIELSANQVAKRPNDQNHESEHEDSSHMADVSDQENQRENSDYTDEELRNLDKAIENMETIVLEENRGKRFDPEHIPYLIADRVKKLDEYSAFDRNFVKKRVLAMPLERAKRLDIITQSPFSETYGGRP